MSDASTAMGIPDWRVRLVFGKTRIDFDPQKEDANRKKHGYSLESAVALFEQLLLPMPGSRPFITSDAFMEKGEVRQMHLGVDDGGHVVHFVTTMRPDETIRVISFRRASAEERMTFLKITGYARQEG